MFLIPILVTVLFLCVIAITLDNSGEPKNVKASPLMPPDEFI